MKCADVIIQAPVHDEIASGKHLTAVPMKHVRLAEIARGLKANLTPLL
jgi:hypothetical protein